MSPDISSTTTKMPCLARPATSPTVWPAARITLTGVPTQPGVTCFGSSNSNKFVTNAGARSRYYSVVGQQFVPYPAAGSVPPSHFNSAPYEYAQRQDTRYLAGLSLHLTVNESVKPYLDFSFMNDRTLTQIAPSGLFQGQQYSLEQRNVFHQLQQSLAECARGGDDLYACADCGG